MEDIFGCRVTRENSGKTSESTIKRLKNIEWIKNLNRDNLSFNEQIRQIIISTTIEDEKIVMQFPGKESSKDRKEIRPWDFVPKLIKSNGEMMDDLSFIDVWEVLYSMFLPKKEKSNKQIRLLASIFYRLAFMNDSHLINPYLQMREITKNSPQDWIYCSFPSFYSYQPDLEIISELGNEFGKFNDVSLEGFLRYNDLLAWNEDCKYYFRSMHTENGKKEWIKSIGRVNNLLSHVSMIGFILGDIKFSTIMGKFVNGRGVAPASWQEVLRISG